MEVLREYAVGATILFPLIDRGTQDFESTPVTFASGDTQISKDEAAFANTNSNPVHEGNGIYSLALTGAEMTAARIVVTVIDSATKTWEDQAILIQSFGNASAGLGIQLDELNTPADVQTWNTFTDPVSGLEHAYSLVGTVVDTGATTIEFDGNSSLSAADDFYNGHTVIFGRLVDGPANPGLGRRIDNYIGATRTFQFTEPWPVAPSNTDPFVIVAFQDDQTSSGAGVGAE